MYHLLQYICADSYEATSMSLVPQRNLGWGGCTVKTGLNPNFNNFTDRSKPVLLLWIIYVISFNWYAFMDVWLLMPVFTCWERTDPLALVCDVKLWRCHFPIGILGQVWCWIVSIPDLCPLSYFAIILNIPLIDSWILPSFSLKFNTSSGPVKFNTQNILHRSYDNHKKTQKRQ